MFEKSNALWAKGKFHCRLWDETLIETIVEGLKAHRKNRISTAGDGYSYFGHGLKGFVFLNVLWMQHYRKSCGHTDDIMHISFCKTP